MNRGKRADVAELADAHDSKSCGAIRAGSSPATSTKNRLERDGFFPFKRQNSEAKRSEMCQIASDFFFLPPDLRFLT